MRRLLINATACYAASMLMLAASAASAADIVIYDNYPSSVTQPQVGLTSETNTSLPDTTWTVDDAFLASAATPITRIDWVGERVVGAGVSYPTAEIVLLPVDDAEGAPNPGPLNSPLAISRTGLSYTTINDIADPNPNDNLVPYTGSVLFPSALTAPGQHFYVGIRLVGNTHGRNYFVPTSTNGTVRGLSGGYTKADLFTGLSGPDAWKPSSDTYYGTAPGTEPAFEFAFRLYTTPEPGSVGLLLIGLAAWWMRRRI